jgi:hypothetical protein
MKEAFFGSLPFMTALPFMVIIAMLFVLAVLWLFHGWKAYKVFVAALSGIAAAATGACFAVPHLPAQWGWVAPIVFAAAGITIAFLMERVFMFGAMGLMGAVVFAVMAVFVFNVAPWPISTTLGALAAAGFLLAGVPAAIFHKHVVVVLTSLWGSLIALGATGSVVAVCMGGTSVFTKTGAAEAAKPLTTGSDTLLVVAITWLTLAVIGAVVQFRTMMEEGSKKAQTA